jgi:uncharacterized protein
MGSFYDAPPPPPPPPGGPWPAAGSLGYGPRGQSDDQLWAMLSYLLTFVVGILAPLIIYLIKMKESGYVRYHSAQSLNMAITAFIYTFGGIIVGLVLGFATHGFALILIIPLFIAYAIAHLVYLILACIAANRGEAYRVPTALALPMVH